MRTAWAPRVLLVSWFIAVASWVLFRLRLSLIPILALVALASLLFICLIPSQAVFGGLWFFAVTVSGLCILGRLALTVPAIRRTMRSFVTHTGRSFQRHLKKSVPDLLYFHDLTVLEDLDFRNLASPPAVIWDAHEFYPGQLQKGPGADEIVRAIQRVSGSIDGFVTVNAPIAGLYSRLIPGLPTPTIVHNAADWHGPVESDGRLHEASGLRIETRILLYHGYLHPKRGVGYLLDVANNLPDNWAVVFMGGGELAGDIRRVMKGGGQGGREALKVALIPPAPADELVLWTAGASLGAIFYEPETINQKLASPNKLWEYARAGVPTVSYSGTFLKKTIEENGIGWVVDYSSSPERTAALISQLSEQDLSLARRKSLQFAEKSNSRTEEEKLRLALLDVMAHRVRHATFPMFKHFDSE